MPASQPAQFIFLFKFTVWRWRYGVHGCLTVAREVLAKRLNANTVIAMAQFEWWRKKIWKKDSICCEQVLKHFKKQERGRGGANEAEVCMRCWARNLFCSFRKLIRNRWSVVRFRLRDDIPHCSWQFTSHLIHDSDIVGWSWAMSGNTSTTLRIPSIDWPWPTKQNAMHLSKKKKKTTKAQPATVK